jgi:hypothetical protein
VHCFNLWRFIRRLCMCMYVCMHARMYVCMYVCICMCFSDINGASISSSSSVRGGGPVCTVSNFGALFKGCVYAFR